MDVSGFLRWWVDQLADLVPGGLSAGSGRLRDALIVTSRAGRIEVLSRRGGKETPVSLTATDNAARAVELRRRGGSPAATLLRPEAHHGLRKRLSLPAGAARHLRRMLPFELERETPFAANEILWDFAVARRDAQNQRIAVEVALVARDTVAPLAAFAEAAGLKPAGVELSLSDGAARVVPLSGAAVSAQDRWLPRLAGAAAVLAIAAAAVPWLVQERAIGALEERLAALRAEAREAADLRQEIARLSGRAEFLVAERGRSMGALGALAAATRALPDDSHLQSLALRGDRLTLRGSSPRAADLILRFAEFPSFQDPAFLSPVVRSGDGELESFMIGVNLVAPKDTP